MNPDAEKTQTMLQKRNAKVQNHLAQYAPIWLVQEEIILDEDTIQFEVVFLHPRYQWVRRRYRYDFYNDTLYQLGQVAVDEGDTFDLQNQEPFISTEVMNTVNSYGG